MHTAFCNNFGFPDKQLESHGKLFRQITKGMINTIIPGPKSSDKPYKRPVDIPEDSARAKLSREMILQTKQIVVDILQVGFKIITKTAIELKF